MKAGIPEVLQQAVVLLQLQRQPLDLDTQGLQRCYLLPHCSLLLRAVVPALQRHPLASLLRHAKLAYPSHPAANQQAAACVMTSAQLRYMLYNKNSFEQQFRSLPCSTSVTVE
jgi:hypothetical protein